MERSRSGVQAKWLAINGTVSELMGWRRYGTQHFRQSLRDS